MSGSTGRGYSFRISAEGMQEFAADMRRLSGESEGAQQAFSKLIQASPELASAMTRAEEATKRAADRARDLREANERAAASAAALPAATARVGDSFEALERRALAARRGVADFRGALELVGAGAASTALGPVAAQIGNVADLFGTAGLAAGAFGSGVSGLTSLLGPLAVGVAAVGGAAYALSLSYESAARAQEQARAADEAYQRALRESNALLGTNGELVETATQRRRREAIAANENALAIERENLARANEATSRAAAVRSRLEEVAATGRDVSQGLARARATESGLGDIITAQQGRIAELERVTRALRDQQYDAPIGPQPQVVRAVDPTGSRAAGDDPITRMVNAAVERDRERQRREAEQAARAQEAEERRRADAVRRFEQQSLEAFARIGETALERIGGSLVDAFVRGEQSALRFGNLLRGVVASAATDLLRLGAVNPLANAMFGLSRPTLGGAASALGVGGEGGFGGLLSMGGSVASLGSALGLGGLGASVSGFLATPVLAGTSGLAAGGLSGAGGLAALEASGIGASGVGGLAGPTLGGLLGVGALGAVGGGFLASMTGGNSTGGSIGGGLGAAAGFMLGGPVGALIGGAAGGALGGLFGPRGNRPGFYNLDVAAGADGMLGITSAGGKRADQQLAALRQQTEREIAQLNQVMASLGLRAEGAAMLGQNVGTNQAGSLGEAANRFRLIAGDARIQGAIDRAGGGLGAIGAAQQASELIGALAQITRAAEDAANPITAISRQFDALRDASARLGFGFAEVEAAQRRAVGAAIAPSISGLADYARGLRTANDNSGNPLSRLAAAEADFTATASRAQSGDLSALGRLQQAAEQFRGLSRQVFGTGSGFADAESRIVAALESIGGLSSDQLTASVLAAETRNQTDTLVAALGRLQDEVAALRREARQQGSNPLAARVA